MNRFKQILTYLFGVLMILGGIFHFLTPEMYQPFIPDHLPKDPMIYGSGAVEIAVGIGVFFSRVRSIATLGILLLMLAFLPLHIWDVFREDPAIGSGALARIRLPIQLILILWAWYIHKNSRQVPS